MYVVDKYLEGVSPVSLLNILKVPDEEVLDPQYYVLLETHVHYLKKHPNTQLVEVMGQQAEKYTGDLSGLLDSLAVDKKYHYLIARINDLTACTEYDGKKTLLLIPDTNIARQFMTIFNSRED